LTEVLYPERMARKKTGKPRGRPKKIHGNARHVGLRVGTEDEFSILLDAAVLASGKDQQQVVIEAALPGLRAQVKRRRGSVSRSRVTTEKTASP
jgi:hypothetical protein